MTDCLVDARGMRCPWPVLRLARAARELRGPGRIRVLADDPIAGSEIEALCAERGWLFMPDADAMGTYEIVIRGEA